MISQFAYTTPAKLLDRLQRLRENRRSRAELDACSPSELHRIAQDVGLTGEELRSLDCSHPGPSELMPRRLEQLGLDTAYVKNAHTATYRDLERVCATCKAWRRCARDLAQGDVQTGMTRYCLNAPTIDALLLERAR
jgi:hypothetical protein